MVTYEELYKIAGLAKLSLEGGDMDALSADMSGIIEFANAVSEAGIRSCGPEKDLPETVLRKDEIQPSMPPELILKNAHESSDGFFLAHGKGLTDE